MKILNKKEIGIKGYLGESGRVPENRVVVCPHCKSTLEITPTWADWCSDQLHLVDSEQVVYITECPGCHGKLGFYNRGGREMTRSEEVEKFCRENGHIDPVCFIGIDDHGNMAFYDLWPYDHSSEPSPATVAVVKYGEVSSLWNKLFMPED